MDKFFENFPKNVLKRSEAQIPSFSIDSLRNPDVSLDPNKSGQYSQFLHEASYALRKVVQEGLWSPKQAKDYARGIQKCVNALEVFRRNTLIKNIAEDRPMDMTWGYEEKENLEIYEQLNQILGLDTLIETKQESVGQGGDKVTKATAKLQQLFKGGGK